MSVLPLIQFEIQPVNYLPNALVSKSGDVFTRDRKAPNILNLKKPYLGKVGYHVITLPYEKYRAKPFYIHRMVAETFLPRPPGKVEVRHLDGSRTNNDISNLAWGTRKENCEDTRRHGRMLMGEKIKNSVLTSMDVQVVRYLLKRGKSARSIALVFDVSPGTIADIKTGRNWSHLPDAQDELGV